MKEFVQFVDKIYCINLDSRKERWEQAVQEFTRVGIIDSVTRVSAVVADDPREGCLRSHFNCINEAIDKGYENILILEDDVGFLPYDWSILKEAAEFLKGDTRWDLFYLGGDVMYPAKFVHKHVFKSRFFCTHAYVVNRRAYKKILHATVPIDLWYALNTVSYGIFPLCATQIETYSDIQQKQMVDRQLSLNRKYDLLVMPNIMMRWFNYFKTHYWIRYRSYFRKKKRSAQ